MKNLPFIATPLKSGSCGVGLICDINGTKDHKIIRWGIEAVRNLTHRGAVGADGKTGDGAGVLFQIPKKFFLREIERLGYRLSHADNLAVGVFFLGDGKEPDIEAAVERFGLKAIGWREVPAVDDALGWAALSTKPKIRQLLIDTVDIEPEKRELQLFLARRLIEKQYGGSAYVVCMSSKVIIYKGMLVASNLDWFYPDLTARDFESSFCIFHQRFSTNTFPEWSLAQPFRVIAHNGEINTIQGNRNWMASIEPEARHASFETVFDKEITRPLISFDESDSASLDRIMELLILSGFPPEHAINMCIPPVTGCYEFTGEQEEREIEAFFEYQSFLMKPWDGPAAIVFTDGDSAGMHLDRNGLRPLRYLVTEDGIIVAGSETGMVDLEGRAIIEKGRLGPGETVSIDLRQGRLRFTREILRELSKKKHYREWVDTSRIKIAPGEFLVPESSPDIARVQIAFGYTTEEIQTSIKEMARSGKEMTFSMGDDTPLPSLSVNPPLLFRYFRQRFSQVTNPPIDHIRERMMMSLRMNIGYKKNFLIETPEHARRLTLDSPVLLTAHIKAIEEQNSLKVEKIPVTFPLAGRGSLLREAVIRLQEKVIDSVRKGTEIIILSDAGISREKAAIPGLLAVSASFKALQREGISNRASIIMETGEARDTHHMACLIGYNASAVYPYLALQTVKELCDKGDIALPPEKAIANYKRALEDGLLKIIAKMGICTLNSYYGAQLFDSICLNMNFVDEYFRGTPVSVESDGLPEIEHSLVKRHASGFSSGAVKMEYGGNLSYRKGGEVHAWSPASVTAFKNFIKDAAYSSYKEFSRTADSYPVFLRHLMDYKKGVPVPSDEVEPAEHILKRFFSGAMSVGSLSPEAHETIAEACNRLGIRSNSGEGGEDPLRYWSTKNSAIKQIASGRFGVTPAYLASAAELEIKIAQGAKPGEGGHLPSDKVTEYIASLRHCRPGIILISPPPHHDIYSIEDLAQLIHDIKQANPAAKVCVKLVSETGVGTVAAGVAKAYADIVQICGCEGGTGAASISSIKQTGNYWEIGLAEVQRILMENNLRDRIRVRVDGGLRTGRDIVIAALLGAEEYGFGTATMIATGCIMARQCHLNTCPTGIATQDKKLRGRFKGTAENIMAYFTSVAGEVREILAGMGFRSIEEIIGRNDLLSNTHYDSPSSAKRMVLKSFREKYPEGITRTCTRERNDNPLPSMNDMLVRDLLPYIEKAEPVEKEYRISNTDRSIPVKLNYHVAVRYRDKGLPQDTVRLTFRGTAGQSFGAFTHKGIAITLIGDANDYVGKGMFGGRIIIRPADVKNSHLRVIAGNTVLYGATGGEFYCAGRAGERFAVRNSGATAVIEGTGHHLCEYMTTGTVVVLGEAGCNVGAGMTGGVIYVYDEYDALFKRLNSSYVTSFGLKEAEDIKTLRTLVKNHYENTGSPRAYAILDNFDRSVGYFKKIVPCECEE